jgi:hypothetical protein
MHPDEGVLRGERGGKGRRVSGISPINEFLREFDEFANTPICMDRSKSAVSHPDSRTGYRK